MNATRTMLPTMNAAARARKAEENATTNRSGEIEGGKMESLARIPKAGRRAEERGGEKEGREKNKNRRRKPYSISFQGVLFSFFLLMFSPTIILH